MRLILALLVAIGIAGPAHAQNLVCPAASPPVFVANSWGVPPGDCAPIIYNGSGAATLTLPPAQWQGTVIDAGPGVVTLAGDRGEPVNGSGAGVAMVPGSGGIVAGTPFAPAAGWTYSGPTSAFPTALLPGGTNGQLQVNSGGAFGGTSAPSGLASAGFSTGLTAFVLQQGANTSALPVPVFYPATSGASVLAFDTVPKGSPTDNGYGLTWADFCNFDIEASPSHAAECLHIGSRASTQDIASTEYSAGTIGNLRIGLENGDTASFTPYITISAGGAQTPSGGTLNLAPSGGTLNLGGVTNGGTASKYVCVDGSGNVVIQTAAC